MSSLILRVKAACSRDKAKSPLRSRPMSNEPTLISEPENAESDAGSSAGSESAGKFPFGMARVVKILVLAGVVGLLFYLYRQGLLTQENLKQITAALPTAVFLPVFLVSPLIGFPINVLLLASGMKYDFATALGIAAVGMGLHTISAWYLAHSLFRKRIEALLSDTRFELPKIPKHHQIWFTSVFVTIPGLPYAIKLYSLALTNLPFRRYLTIVWLVHVLNAIPLIGIGTLAVNLNVAWLLVLGVLGILTVIATAWLNSWFSRSLAEGEDESEETPPAANGEKSP